MPQKHFPKQYLQVGINIIFEDFLKIICNTFHGEEISV